MAKLRMKYKAPVEGRKVDITAPTYARLKAVAYESGCTIGQWCESNLAHRLRLQMMSAPPPASAQPKGLFAKVHHFEISEGLYDDIERFVAKHGKTAQFWIACTIMDCLRIEEVRIRGVTAEPDRFG